MRKYYKIINLTNKNCLQINLIIVHIIIYYNRIHINILQAELKLFLPFIREYCLNGQKLNIKLKYKYADIEMEII